MCLTKTRTIGLFQCLLIGFSFALATESVGQVLLSDDFNGTGLIDQTKWRLAFGGDPDDPENNPAFIGRTLLRTDLSTGYPMQAGGVATLELDTYVDDGMGGSAGIFLGHEINTKRNFARAGGLRFEGRMRLKDTPPGLVGAMFMFDVQRTNMDGDAVRDEADHELLTNEVQMGGQNRLLTQYFNDGPFGEEGNPLFETPAITGGWDMTDFHDYRIDWLPNRLDYYVDGQLVRSSTNNIPDDPMNARFNLWAPDSTFPEAFSNALQPAATPGENQTYGMEIDHVTITRLNTTESANLLVNESFEDSVFGWYDAGDLPMGVTQADTGAWFFFVPPEASFDTQAVRTGDLALKTFGPFFENPNASGAWQNVDVNPGDVLEGRVFAQSISSDSIKGMSNYAEITIEFLDADGTVLDFTNSSSPNNKTSVIMEGRDPDMPEDVWVEGVVNAIAPADAVRARLKLPMVNLEGQGGAVWWDDATLVTLMAETSTLGDFTGPEGTPDGVWDCLDIDALVDAIVNEGDLSFDMNGDGELTLEDITQPSQGWLAVGGSENVAETGGNPFLEGDANLDGVVDGQDFFEWNGSKFTSVAEWCSGDFNADGVVDGQDFFLWNANKFTSSTGNAPAVPEPAALNLLLLAGLWGWRMTRRR